MVEEMLPWLSCRVVPTVLSGSFTIHDGKVHKKAAKTSCLCNEIVHLPYCKLNSSKDETNASCSA
jgi:hypothetical protein